jgi:hypothetical protein
VADHSRSAGYAGGLSIDEVQEQHALVDELNAPYQGKFRILKGIESDILQDGSLDYPDEVLASFVFVVASVHSRFGLDARTQTDRIVRAVSNPFTTILGHLTGRMLLRRPDYEVDIDVILSACAEHGSLSKSMRTLTGSIWTGDGTGEPSNWGVCSASTLMHTQSMSSTSPAGACSWPAKAVSRQSASSIAWI